MLTRTVRWAPDAGGGAAGGGASGTTASGMTGERPADGLGVPGTAAAGQGPQTWDAFVATLPEAARTLYEGHVTGLRNTVAATRQERDTMKARVDALIAALDGKEPAAVKQQLTELQGELTAARTQATFFEEAGKPEIGCRNPRLAYLVAQAGGHLTRSGAPDWAAIKREAPELFGMATPPGNAGAGTQTPPAKTGMNAFIRRAAGRE